MDLLPQLGNQIAQIPVVDKTRLGNEDGMVTWVKKPDGTFDYDYSLVEQYLKLVKKHWACRSSSCSVSITPPAGMPAKPDQENTVTVLDPQTGQREHLQVPVFGTEESKKFLAPVLLGLKERLAKEGMEKSLVMGQLTEGIPGESLFKEFSDILGPDVNWMRTTHVNYGTPGQRHAAERRRQGLAVHLHLLGPAAVRRRPAAAGPWQLLAARRLPPLVGTAWATRCSFSGSTRSMPGFGTARGSRTLALDFWPGPKYGRHVRPLAAR